MFICLFYFSNLSISAAIRPIPQNTQNENLENYDIMAVVVAPEDESVIVSSEKVAENSLSSLDGYDSKSGGFDFAVAFTGNSAYVRVDLTVRTTI